MPLSVFDETEQEQRVFSVRTDAGAIDDAAEIDTVLEPEHESREQRTMRLRAQLAREFYELLEADIAAKSTPAHVPSGELASVLHRRGLGNDLPMVLSYSVEDLAGRIPEEDQEALRGIARLTRDIRLGIVLSTEVLAALGGAKLLDGAVGGNMERIRSLLLRGQQVQHEIPVQETSSLVA